MATKTKSLSGIDRAIATQRKELAKIKKIASDKKKASKKARTLKSLQLRVRNLKKRK